MAAISNDQRCKSIQTLIQKLISTCESTDDILLSCSTGNKISSSSLNQKFNKADLITVTLQIIGNVSRFKDILTDLEANLNDYMAINKNHEAVTEKIIQKIADVTKAELKKCFPQSSQNEKVPKKQIVSNEKQVLIINDINKKDIKEDKSFSEALKENLSNKLQGIPISKTTLNREGKAVLKFPDPESCTQAKASLQKDYNVENSDRKPTIIQPRIKIHNLDPSLTEYNKGKLQAMIASKNESLKMATNHEFEITFIDTKQNFAIAKVSPDIHKKLINDDVYTLTFGRIKCLIISIQSNVFVVKVSITQALPPYVSQKTSQMIQPVFTAVKIINHPNVPQKKIKRHTNALIA